MAHFCSLRIFTAPAGGLTGLHELGMGRGDHYYTIPLAMKKSYKVANDTTHNKAFTIQAFTYNSDTGNSVHQGAFPSLIRDAMVQNPIEISSATDRAYVNVSVKEETKQAPAHGIISKLSFSAGAGASALLNATHSWMKLAMGGLKMMHGLKEAAEPDEVYFSITALRTPATVYSFKGVKTLNEINIALWRRKAWAVADKTTASTIEAVVGALAEGLGGVEFSDEEVGNLVDKALLLREKLQG